MNFLIVDDIKTNRESIKLSLEKFIDKNNITIFEASNGIEALKIVEKNKIDLIFMDIMMPNMNGYSAIKNIKSKSDNKNIYIIVLTALDSEDEIQKAMNVGADSFVVKPFKKANLLIEIKTFMKLKNSKKENQSAVATKSKQPYSLYKDKFKNVLTIFSILNEDDVASIWDFTDGFYAFYDKTNLVKFLSLMYELENNVEYFAVIMEIGENSLYFSIDNQEAVNYLKTKKIDLAYKVENLITFRLYLVEERKKEAKKDKKEIDSFKNFDEEFAEEFSNEREFLEEMNKSYNRVSAQEYFQNHTINTDVVEIFVNLDARLEEIFYESDTISQDEIDVLILIFDEFMESLNHLYVFTNLAYVLQSLTSVLKTLNIYSMDDQFKKEMFEFLLSVSKDLLKWSRVVLVEKTAKDIHYLETSLMSSVQQFEKTLNEHNATFSFDNDDDFELF